jgi:peptidoglycan lytic transglycosylase
LAGDSVSRRGKLWVAVLGLVAASAYAQGTGTDEDLLAAREAFQAGNAARLETLAQRLQGHLLEPYVAYWQLSLTLGEAAPEEVRAFLTANRGGPLAWQLRGEWLKALARREEWELFDAELPLHAGADDEIACYALQSRVRANPEMALREARSKRFIVRDLPDSCSPALSALAATGALTSDDLWLRIRLTLEGGQVTQARRVAEWLPKGEAPEPGLLESVASNPAGYLMRRNFRLKTRAGREAVMFAAHRLARTSTRQAADHWRNLEERFSGDERAYVWGMIAYLGAMRHDPEALGWYARAGALSDVQLAWKARAALRAGNWPDVLAAVNAMSERESAVSAWRYWKARALKALERPEEAEALLRPLSVEFGFYGLLAQEDLGGTVAVPATVYTPAAEDVRAMGQRIGLRRALELYRLNLRTEATQEWIWAIRRFDDRQLLAAAEVARSHEIYDRAIGTANLTVALHDFGLRYLAPYRATLKTHTSQLALDEAWVYGLIRQESRFIPDATSSAGASGLMQIMPGTARWVARKLGLKNWRWSQVTELDTNIGFGTYYLRHVLDALDGQPVLASAAYNAGPNRARAWRPDAAMEGAVFAETIPFTETRIYVKNVMANSTYYAHTFGQQIQSLKQRLGVIGARRDREAAAADLP